MRPAKYIVQLFCVCFLALVSCIPSVYAEAEIALPVNAVSSVTAAAGEEPLYLAPYIRYAYNLDAKDAKSALAQKDSFIPYDVLSLKKELGTYWFLISFERIKDKDAPTAYLDLGNFLPKNSHVLVFSNSTKRWQVLEDVYTTERKSHEDSFDVEKKNSVNIFHSGLYDLTSLRDGGQLLIYSPGVPSIWFSPKLLSPAKAPLTLDKRLTPLLLLAIFVLMIFVFWRGAKEEGDARIWAAFLALAVVVQFAWGVPQNVNGRLEYLDMVGVIASCMAVFFLPHIGRHLLVTEKKSPHFDSLLQFLAIPAIFPLIVLFVPIPEYLFIVRFAPLWGLYALVLFILTIPLVLSGRKGARLYAFFCLAVGAGCLGALALRHDSEWYFLNYLGVFVAMITIFLAPRQTEKNIFDEKLSHEDIVSAFAENNTIMRDALYRVELKLRDPFDRIMREACFLDFDLKTEELADSLALLKDKALGDRVERNTKNAIDDVNARTQRLQEHTSSLVLACRDLSGMLGHITDLAQKEPMHPEVHEYFNVKTLITQACDNIRAEAQDRQIGLGWYIAPNIGLHYRGDKASLEVVLSLLLRDAVRATEKGMISVRVRRANSPNPGHIIFTISDSGKGRPPVQRSILTLIKAWELSTAYNGEVELRSSPHGLSFSFSMQCLAMDQNGEKPLSYASLDDIVLSHGESAYPRKAAGLSGGNILFAKESEEETQDEEENISFAGSRKDTSILIISPLAIQRQNFVYYLNKYETWEALDVDSALAFYEKKPASLVLVHSALSASGCSAVIAGIRLLEDNLGIAHAPCVGLYQSAKDMEFLRLAGCNHTLPDNIGREDLCTAVAEIVGDKSIQPITDIEAPHTVVKNVDKKIKKAVEKRLNAERVHAGSVVDGAVSSLSFSAPEADFAVRENTHADKETVSFAGQGDSAGFVKGGQESKSEAGYEHTLDFHEEKQGVFTRFMKSIRPKPQKFIQTEADSFDDSVGEPTPMQSRSGANAAGGLTINAETAGSEEAFLSLAAEDCAAKRENNADNGTEARCLNTEEAFGTENETAKLQAEISALQTAEADTAELAEPAAVVYAETEDAEIGNTDSAAEKNTAEPGNDGLAVQDKAMSADLGGGQEENGPMSEEAAALFSETEIPVDLAQSEEKENNVSVSDQAEENFASEGEAETDLPAAEHRPDPSDAEGAEVAVQEQECETAHEKILLSFLPSETQYEREIDEDLPPQSVRNALDQIETVEDIRENSVFVQSGLVSLSLQEQPAAAAAEDTGPFLVLQDKEHTEANSEEPGAEVSADLTEKHDEQHIIELSQDMLVLPKDEKPKKKSRKKKEDKSEKSGLDILLDYSASKEQEDERETPKHDDKLVQLSFFPVDDDKK